MLSPLTSSKKPIIYVSRRMRALRATIVHEVIEGLTLNQIFFLL